MLLRLRPTPQQLFVSRNLFTYFCVEYLIVIARRRLTPYFFLIFIRLLFCLKRFRQAKCLACIICYSLLRRPQIFTEFEKCFLFI